MWPFIICGIKFMGLAFYFRKKGIKVKFTQSLKKNFQFRFVYNRGKSLANRNLVMYIVKNNKNNNKLGISVSKKVGKSVTRSRVTRLIRESYRLMENNIKVGFDIVVIARVNVKDASYAEVSKSLYNLLKKHNLLEVKNLEMKNNVEKIENV